MFILDEIDKVGTDFRGDPSSALLEVLDPEQNNAFSDHYLEVAFDLSKVFFITTANVLDTIPPRAARPDGGPAPPRLHRGGEARDREGAHRAAPDRGARPDRRQRSSSTDEAIRTIINDYTREAGVRNLDREIANVCRKVARKVVEGHASKVVVDAARRSHEFLGPVRFFREIAERTDRSGVAIGLAWTQVGGEILFVESTRMRGKGKVTITGRLGRRDEESALAALSWIRSNARALGIDDEHVRAERLPHPRARGRDPEGRPVRRRDADGARSCRC